MTKKSPGGKSGKPATSKPSGRQATVRVKTSAKRSLSSTLWLERQLNDPYVAEAKRQGYRSRAAFKLLQMDERFHLLKSGQKVVDLGAAPGGWTQVAVARVRPEQSKGCVIALDILEMEPIPGAVIFHADFTDPTAPEKLREALGGRADLVISDMAAPTTGHPNTDHMRIMALAELAYAFAAEVLAPGGGFIAKLFQGGADKTLLDALKRDFTTVRHAKPPASRSDSTENYVVATGFRGGAGNGA